MELSKQLFRGSTDLMILSVLAEGSAYGYLIQKRLRDASAKQETLWMGSLYRLLHRLEEQGLIASWWDQQATPKRKWYKITAAGRKKLDHQRAEWREYARCILKLITPENEAEPKTGSI